MVEGSKSWCLVNSVAMSVDCGSVERDILIRFHVIVVGTYSLPQPPPSHGSLDNFSLQVLLGPVVLLGLCRWGGH